MKQGRSPTLADTLVDISSACVDDLPCFTTFFMAIIVPSLI